MAQAGFSVGTFTGGGTFLVESLSGTLTPVGVAAWGGAGTVTRVGPTMAAALPVGIYGGTFNAGTVTVANTGTVVGTVAVSNTGTVVGTVAVSNTGTVVGTVATSNAGTVAMVQAGSVQVTAGTFVGTVAVSTIAAGTVVATAAGTQVVSGTVNTGNSGTIATITAGTLNMLQAGTVNTANAGTVAMVQAGTVTMLQAGSVQVTAGTFVGTVTALAAGTQTVAGTVAVSGGTVNPAIGNGKTLLYGTVNLTSGSVSLVNPGTGTTAYIVGMHLQAGTVGVIQFLQGVGAAALSGPMPTDQYGGFVNWSTPAAPILKSAAGSQVYLSIISGIGTIAGYYSYFVEV